MGGAMPRIALYLPNFAGGGMERVMLHLAEGFLARGHEVDLLVSSAEGPYRHRVPAAARVVVLERAGALRSRLLALRASVASDWRSLARPVLLALRSARQLLCLPALARYLGERRPDALIAAYPYCNLSAVWARRLAQVDTRVMLTEHNMLSRKIAAKGGKGAQWRELPPLIGKVYRQADAIVAVSRGVADDLSATAGLPRERIEIVYNPVVTAELAALAGEPAPHPWLAVRDGVPVIVAAGRLVPQKNFPLLLRAFARLRERRPARLLIFGEGPGRRELEGVGPCARHRRRPRAAGLRGQPLCGLRPGCPVRPVVGLRRLAQRPDRGHGLRLSGCEHGLSQWPGGDPAGRSLGRAGELRR